MIDNSDPATIALLGGGEPDVRTLTPEEYLKRKAKLLADYERQRWENDDAAELARITAKFQQKGN